MDRYRARLYEFRGAEKDPRRSSEKLDEDGVGGDWGLVRIVSEVIGKGLFTPVAMYFSTAPGR